MSFYVAPIEADILRQCEERAPQIKAKSGNDKCKFAKSFASYYFLKIKFNAPINIASRKFKLPLGVNIL